MRLSTEAPTRPRSAEVRGPAAAGPGLVRRTGARLLGDRGGLFGLAILVSFVALALLAPLLAPYDPLDIGADVPLAAPSRAHLFGTDDLGRDVLARILFGARISLTVSLLSAAGALILA